MKGRFRAGLVGPPSGFTMFRYLAQGLFGETIVLAAALAWSHSRSTLRARSALLAAAALALFAVYVEAYHREPADLHVRRHPAVLPSAGPQPRPLRIVHISDLQTDTIGPFQERAMRQALAESPDLIVFTGDRGDEREAMLELERTIFGSEPDPPSAAVARVGRRAGRSRSAGARRGARLRDARAPQSD